MDQELIRNRPKVVDDLKFHDIPKPSHQTGVTSMLQSFHRDRPNTFSHTRVQCSSILEYNAHQFFQQPIGLPGSW